MSVFTLSSYSSVSYSLTPGGSNAITLSQTGTLDVSASNVAAIYSQVGMAGTVANYGHILAMRGTGVSLTSGGLVINGSANQPTAQINAGDYGVSFDARASGTLMNYGTISATIAGASYTGIAVSFGGDGLVVNGSSADTVATIAGDGTGVRMTGSAATIQNYGTIEAFGSLSYGIYLRDGGSVTNGSVSDTSAVVNGYYLGIQTTTKGASVVNYGTIESFSTISAFGRAVHLCAGGTAVNGSAVDTSALMLGEQTGLYIKGPSNNGAAGFSPSQVFNDGTIEGILSNGVYIRLGQNSLVVNGAANDTSALIEGAAAGVRIQSLAPATVVNFGTIAGGSGGGVALSASGTVINGSVTDTSAAISGTGTNGISLGGAGASTVTNFGTIELLGTTSSRNIALYGSGTVTNGGLSDHAASIIGGGTGISELAGYALIANYGTISSGVGISFYKSNGHVVLTGSGTVINDGLIASTSGSSGTAIKFGYGNERLIVDPGASFVGKVLGGTGTNTLELANGGAGHINGIGSYFTNFGTIVVDTGAYWIMTGANTIAAGVTLINGGTLVDAGSLLVQGKVGYNVSVAGGATLVNAGTIGSVGSAASFGSGAVLTIDPGAMFVGGVAAAGDTQLELANGGSTGTLSGLASAYSGFGSVIVDNGAYWILTGSNTLLGGVSLTNSGTLAVVGTLSNFGSIGGVVTVASGGTLVNQGTLGGTGSTAATAVTLASGGRLILDAGESVVGKLTGTSGTTLELAGGTGTGRLSGLGGSISGFTKLVVDAGAAWSLTGNNTVASGAALTIAGTFVDAGTLADVGSISGPVTVANGATLSVSGTLAGGPASTVAGGGLLVLNPGAAVGSVSGAAGATLELANGGAATLSGLGVSISGFGSVLVDHAANWTVTGNNSIGSGMLLSNSGTFTDAGTLTVAGATSGPITVASGATLVDQGTLGFGGSANSTAASVAAGGRLVLAPSATFVGRLTGGGTGSVLELASGGTGTLTSLGSNVSNFGSLVVDSGATWVLSGPSTIAVGTTLSDLGTLTANGVLLNSGSIGSGMTIAGGATLANYGTIGNGGTAVTFAAPGGLLQVGSAGVFNGAVAGGGLTTMEFLTGSAGTLSGLDGSNAGDRDERRENLDVQRHGQP